MTEEHNKAITNQITQLSVHRGEYDEHKRLLQERFDEQAHFHATSAAAASAAQPAAATAAAPAEEPDDKDKESGSNDGD
ncbi:MAG: hypothetical protein ACKPKO_60770, partial [Candidatus Fonsibacter sp.]